MAAAATAITLSCASAYAAAIPSSPSARQQNRIPLAMRREYARRWGLQHDELPTLPVARRPAAQVLSVVRPRPAHQARGVLPGERGDPGGSRPGAPRLPL